MANKKMLKTYHGLPKTPIDDNTVFYASFDGSVIPEVGGIISLPSTPPYKPAPTGLAQYIIGNTSYSFSIGNGVLTLDLLLLDDLTKTNGYDYINLCDSANNVLFRLWRANNILYMSNAAYTPKAQANRESTWTHYRAVITVGKISLAKNGGVPVVTDDATITGAVINSISRMTLGGTSAGVYMADVSISNIDRGNYFPTLPKDFIEGNARISPAFNIQRRVLADPLTSQYTCEVVRAYANPRNPQHIVTQATQGTWASGDTIKVTGLGGEIISGVIDSDTALTTLLVADGTTTSVVSDVSKFAVNDTVILQSASAGTSSQLTITAIDIANNKVTFGSSTVSSNWNNSLIIETTASTSSPVVKFMNGSTLTAVAGTWSGLGTSLATFTLGTNAGLTNQDLQVEYSLNMITGQGGISEVLAATLGGEILGKKYDPGFTKLSTDFNGKIAGSTVENPNIAKHNHLGTQTSLLVPSAFPSEFVANVYNQISLNDNVTGYVSSATANGAIPQVLFSFDLIALVERKYGTIPGNTLVDKVAWLKNNIDKLTFNWYGYGSCPSGNKAYLGVYNISTSVWETSAKNSTNISSLSTYVVDSASNAPSYRIDSSGFIHFLAYTDASDGVTASTVYTDYIKLDVQLKFEAWQTLGGAPYTLANRRLTPGTVVVRDDFKGKISGSTVENPNISKRVALPTLQTPTGTWSERDNLGYSNLASLDGSNDILLLINNTYISQQLFSFNLIRMIEDKFGVIPALDKVAWIKANVNKITCNWLGYGNCPGGNKAILAAWKASNSSYASSTPITASTPTLIQLVHTTTSGASVSDIIDSNGYVNWMAYTDASDGVTASTIYTDYVYVDVELKTPAGYDVLVPENPRRDDGMANVVLVRKETKEVQTMFGATNENRVVSYGDYIPYAGQTKATAIPLAMLPQLFMTTGGTGSAEQTSKYKNAVSRLPKGGSYVEYEFTNDNIIAPFSSADEAKMIRDSDTVAQAGQGINNSGNTTITDGTTLKSARKDLLSNVKLVAASVALVNLNGELMMKVRAEKNTTGNGNSVGSGGSAVADYRLPNRPLIK